MKNLFVLISFLITSNLIGQYYPIIVDNPVWSIAEFSPGEHPTSPDNCIARHYSLVGDTIIEGITYSKLYGNNLPHDFPYGNVKFNLEDATYLAAIREDSTKKVWIRNVSDSIDILYYDFDLSVGDTFCFDYFPVDCVPVSFIDSTLIDGEYRRTTGFYMSGGGLETWIEGIGSTTGWFEYPHIATSEWHLLCYKQDQTLVHVHHDIGQCHCDTYTSLKELEDNLVEVNFSPNPAKEVVNINIRNSENGSYKILFRNIDGIVRKEVYIENPASEILINDLPNGIYFVTIYDDQNRSLTRKIIKTGT